MKTNLLLCSAVAALLLPCASRGEDPKPAPSGGDRPNWEQLRDEMRNLPPEERQARMRELREQYGQPGGQAGQRPFAGQAQAQAGGQSPMMGSASGAGRVLLLLNPEQRESLRKASEVDRDAVRELEQKLREARKAVAEAGVGRDFNEDALREKLEAAAKLDTELAIHRARMLANIEPPLTDEQIEKIKNPPPMGEMLRDRRPDAFQARPPGDRPPPPQGQRPPPDQF